MSQTEKSRKRRLQETEQDGPRAKRSLAEAVTGPCRSWKLDIVSAATLAADPESYVPVVDEAWTAHSEQFRQLKTMALDRADDCYVFSSSNADMVAFQKLLLSLTSEPAPLDVATMVRIAHCFMCDAAVLDRLFEAARAVLQRAAFSSVDGEEDLAAQCRSALACLFAAAPANRAVSSRPGETAASVLRGAWDDLFGLDAGRDDARVEQASGRVERLLAACGPPDMESAWPGVRCLLTACFLPLFGGFVARYLGDSLVVRDEAELCARIRDEYLPWLDGRLAQLGPNVVVAGGAFAWAASSATERPRPASDCDLWVVGDTEAERLGTFARLVSGFPRGSLVAGTSKADDQWDAVWNVAVPGARHNVQIIVTEYAHAFQVARDFDLDHVAGWYCPATGARVALRCAEAWKTRKTRTHAGQEHCVRPDRWYKAIADGYAVVGQPEPPSQTVGGFDAHKYVLLSEKPSTEEQERQRYLMGKVFAADEVRLAHEVDWSQRRIAKGRGFGAGQGDYPVASENHRFAEFQLDFGGKFEGETLDRLEAFLSAAVDLRLDSTRRDAYMVPVDRCVVVELPWTLAWCEQNGLDQSADATQCAWLKTDPGLAAKFVSLEKVACLGLLGRKGGFKNYPHLVVPYEGKDNVKFGFQPNAARARHFVSGARITELPSACYVRGSFVVQIARITKDGRGVALRLRATDVQVRNAPNKNSSGLWLDADS